MRDREQQNRKKKRSGDRFNILSREEKDKIHLALRDVHVMRTKYPERAEEYDRQIRALQSELSYHEETRRRPKPRDKKFLIEDQHDN